ncbi:hypothetical protein EI94DRAFT_1720670 [Lactarius quietus]|nr:hypothetical protein EI94DRAFT_1720670 [Lactarius quietus]
MIVSIVFFFLFSLCYCVGFVVSHPPYGSSTFPVSSSFPASTPVLSYRVLPTPFTNISPSSVPHLSHSASSPSTLPTLPPPDPQTVQNMDTVLQRRLSSIIAFVTQVSHIASWLQTLGSNGSWPTSEIDYTTGCSAR